AYVAIALLYGGKDPLLTIRIAAMSGRDCDCNAASAMGVLGTMLGFKRLPSEFSKALPMIRGRKFSYTDYDWTAALKIMEAAALQQLQKNGGGIVEENGEAFLKIPVLEMRPLPLEQWPYGLDAAEVPLPNGTY
ncbi:MAG TPA: ADP-ribosylglycohydrolase family protein, partial [bacterium]|nr:ADP-ribosylglycohydrolase family protein [bacterium]